MNGLAPQTSVIFDRITRLECIKPFVLVGGTAMSLQLNKRQSEDLDFMCWKKSAKDKPEVPISSIKREIEAVGSKGLTVTFTSRSPVPGVSTRELQRCFGAPLCLFDDLISSLECNQHATLSQRVKAAECRTFLQLV